MLNELHDSSGHVGVGKLVWMVRAYYFWPKLFEMCVDVVKDCVAC